jgi:DnaK suppressor protein
MFWFPLCPEKTMTTAQTFDLPRRAALRTALMQRQDALLASQALHTDGSTRVQHAREVLLQDGDDAPAHDSDREIDLVFTDHERQELADIGLALQRLDHDAYGVCIDCGADIPLARLEVMPQALRCLACEQVAEGANR